MKPVHSQEHKRLKSCRIRSAISTLGATAVVLLVVLSAVESVAVTNGDVTFTVVTSPILTVDSNNCPNGDGPHASYVGVEVENVSASNLTNLQINMSDVDIAGGFGFAGGQIATQYVGTLAPGGTNAFYWLIEYPCFFGQTDNLTITLSDLTPSTATTIVPITTDSQLSANAGGVFVSSALGPNAVVGQILDLDVVYDYGNIGNGSEVYFQPVGNADFRADCLQLISAEILSSDINTIDAGVRDRLYFVTSAATNGSGNQITVRFQFKYVCDGVSTTAVPFAAATSGGALKYTGNFDTIIPIDFPQAINSFELAKTATPTSLTSGVGGAVTYSVVVRNTSAVDSYLDQIDDVLPPGVTFTAIDAASDITPANSSVTPPVSATGAISWIGIPETSYFIPGGDSIRLVYTVDVPAVDGLYTNLAQATIGSSTTNSDSAVVAVGSFADLSITKTDGVLSIAAGDTLTYTIVVTNDGPSTATDVQVTDTFPAQIDVAGVTWTCSITGTGTCAPSGSGNLSDLVSLAPGSWATYTVTAPVLPSASGTISNTASLTIPPSLNDPDGGNNSDSDDDTVVISENPSIGVAKTMTATGTGPYAVTIDLYLENFGDVTISSLSLLEDLDAVFGPGNWTLDSAPSLIAGPGSVTLNASFDGSGDTEVFAGAALGVAETAQVRINVTVTNAGTYTNQVTLDGQSPLGDPVTDVSTDGTDPDGSDDDDTPDESDPTVLTFENPSIGVAKTMTATGTGPYAVIIDLYLENFGDVTISSLSLLEDLNAVFGPGNWTLDSAPTVVAGPGSVTLNGAYDGSADTEVFAGASLGVAETAQVRINVTVATSGTYTNQVTLDGQSPLGDPVTDVSTDGTDPDGTDNDDTPDESDPTVLTFEDPSIGVAKTMTATGTGPYAVTIDLYLENFGDVVISSLSLLEDLDAVFGPGNWTLDSAPTVVAGPGSVTLNASYDGSGDTEVFAGASLGVALTTQVRINVTVTNAGTYTNQVTLDGQSPLGDPVTDVSTDGTDPDGSDDDDTPDESDPTVLTFENPSIGVAKTMTATGAGPYAVTIDLYLENFGDVAISSLSLLEDLDAVFGPGNWTLDSAPTVVAGPPSVTLNASYDGSGDTEVFAGASLGVAETAQVRINVTVATSGTYTNQVTLDGQSPLGDPVTDVSTDGTDPDGTDNDDTPDESDPTVLTFEDPSIGVAKTMTATGTGPYAVTIDLYLENFGDVTISSLSLLEDLNAVFGPGNWTLDAAPSLIAGPGSVTLNGAYDGSADTEVFAGASLGVAQTAQVRINVTITNAGTYTNQVTLDGVSPLGDPVTDVSTDGTDPDGSDDDNSPDESDPTVLTFEDPSIGVAKTMTATGTGPYAVTIDLYLENFGDVTISSLSLLEDLDAVFGPGNWTLDSAPTVVAGPGSVTLNASYDGSGDTEVFAGASLGVALTTQVRINVTVTNAGTYTNQVTLDGQSPLGDPVTDVSTDGTDPDGSDDDDTPDESDPTVLTFENPSIGVAKTMTATGAGPYAVTIDLYLENFGDVAISSLSLLEDLDAVFGPGNWTLDSAPTVVAGPPSVTLNASYDGSGDTEVFAGASLGVAETAQVRINVTVATSGTYTNQVTLDGQSPLGDPVTDVSTDGTDPDGTDNDDTPDESDPTVLTFEDPSIGVAKTMTATGTGPYAVTIDLYLENFGDVTISSLSLLEDLNAVFGPGNWTLDAAPSLIAGPGSVTLNGAYDGSADTEVFAGASLGVAQTAQVRINVTITNAGTYTNQVTLDGVSPLGDPVTDVSTDGTDPDGSDDDNSPDESDPTVLTFEDPSIGVAKTMTATGTGPYAVTIDLYLENFGDVTISSLSLLEDLDAVFGPGNWTLDSAPTVVAGPLSVTLNASFDGSADTEVFAGASLGVAQTAQVRINVTITNAGTYTNQVTLDGQSPLGDPVTDVSTDGTDPDGTDNDDTPDESDPTVLTFEDPSIGVAKTMTATGTGPYAVTIDLYLENFGDVTISSLSLLEDLDAVFGPGNWTLDSAPSLIAGPGSVTLNGAYDGSADTEVFAGASLGVAETAQVRINVTVATSGTYTNQVTLDGQSPLGDPVTDVSTDGTDPDGTDNDDTPDESDPTVLTFEDPSIGVAKTMTATGTGPYAVTIDLYLENFGDVTISSLSLLEDLDAVFGPGNWTLDSAPSLIAGPGSVTLNGAYDGSADTEVFAGASLGVAQTAQVRINVTITNAGTYTNQVTLDGVSPLGDPVTDVSTDGTDPDGSDDDNSPDESDPTVATLGSGVIMVSKEALVATTTIGGLVPYALTLENVGSGPVSDVEAVDTPPAGFTYAEGSARLQRAGDDGILGTGDDTTVSIEPSGQRPVRFAPIDLAAGETIRLRYVMRVGAGVTVGDARNQVAVFQNDEPLGNSAGATVEVTDDPLFDRSLLVGKVFHDVNRNGWQDPDTEPGLAGVRVVTATGLIIETDAYGRFHLADIPGSLLERGRELIVKVDPSSLPPGSRFTTENPRVIHITPSVVNRVVFGVELSEPHSLAPRTLADTLHIERSTSARTVVWVEEDQPVKTVVLDHVTFETSKAVLRPAAREAIRSLAASLLADPTATAHVEGHTDARRLTGRAFKDNYELSLARSQSVRTALIEFGVDPSDLTASGYGPDRPVTDGNSAADLQRNRRVEVVIRSRAGTPVYRPVPALITHRVNVRAGSRFAPGQVTLEESLPAGLEYVPGSARDDIGVLGEPEAESGVAGTVLRWTLANIDAGGTRTLTYDTRVISGSETASLDASTRVRRGAGATDWSQRAATPIQVLRTSTSGSSPRKVVDHRVALPARSMEPDQAAIDVITGILDSARDLDLHRVDVIGFAALDEIVEGEDPNAYALSTARANAVAMMVRRGLTIDPTLVHSSGQGISSDDPAAAAIIIRLHVAPDTQASSPPSADDPLRATPASASLEVHDSDGKTMAPSPAGQGVLTLPGGGVANVIQDPGYAHPRLSVMGPDAVRFDNGEVTGPVHFSAYSNYLTFIDRWELLIFAGGSAERTRNLATIAGAGGDLLDGIEWDGTLANHSGLLEGDGLWYVLRVYDSEGRWDETTPSALDVTTAQVEAPDVPDMNRSVYGDDKLGTRGIPVEGARVRVHGTAGDANELLLNGQRVQIDSDGRFAAEEILPPGEHVRVLEVAGEATGGELPFTVDVRRDDSFVVGIVDITVGQNEVNGSTELLKDNSRFDGDVFAQGRLAFYLRQRLDNGVKVTAHVDTREEDLDNLFDRFDQRDPRTLFRRLDPDLYYPTFGDGSTTISDVDTQGRLYGRVEYKRSTLLWGNFAAGLTGNELAEFNRSLYGALLDYRSELVGASGEARFTLKGFASEAQTAYAHDELIGTGGSLYYTHFRDVVQGSEKIWVEVRERDSDRIIERITLERYRDYDFDDLQGRILLRRPLTQVAEQTAPSIIKDQPIDGNRVFLIVDYEYIPASIADTDWTLGARGRAQVHDRVSVGGTWVDEQRAMQNYELLAADVTVHGGDGTYLKAEVAGTEAEQSASSRFSPDGGITFSNMASPGNATMSGQAVSLEGRLDLLDFASTDAEATVWWKRREAGFSTARLASGSEVTDYGSEMRWRSERLMAGARWSTSDHDGLVRNDRVSGQLDWQFRERWQIGGELRFVQADPSNSARTSETLGGVRLGLRAQPGLFLYASAQSELANGDRGNAMGSLGARARLGLAARIRAEISAGERGESVLGGVDLNVNSSHTLYSTYTMSTDRNDGQRGQWVVGQQKSLSDQTQVFTENQVLHGERQSGIVHVYGLRYNPAEEWSVETTYQQSNLDDPSSGDIDRRALSASVGYRNDRLRWHGRGEVRDDGGAVERRQWLTTQRADVQVGPGVTLLGKLNYSLTDPEGGVDEARFAETGLGVALRPVRHDRFQFLAKHSYLYDLGTPDQVWNSPDQRSHVVLGDVVYSWAAKWETGARLAHRVGEVREDRGQGDWFRNRENLAAVRLRYHILFQWDAMGEYRWRWVTETESMRQGALLGVYRHLGDHFKLGAGYNFSDFSDDLTDLDYDNNGWFIKAIGKI